MPDMKLTAEVLLRIEGHEELYNVGTIDVPINVTFGDKPALGNKPGVRTDILEVTGRIDKKQFKRNVEEAVKRGGR